MALIGLEGSQPHEVGSSAIAKLAPCNSNKKNCVTSFNTTSPYHSMEPWKHSGELNSLFVLADMISEDSQAQIIVKKNNYLYIQYRSKFFNFVDDCEFFLTLDGFIHFRSASRLGIKDLGVNRKRMMRLKKKFFSL